MSDNEKNIGLEDINHFELILFAVEKAHQMQMSQKLKINKNMPKNNIVALKEVINNPSTISDLKSSLINRCILGNQETVDLNEEEVSNNMLEELQNSEFMVGIEEQISEKDSIIIGTEEDL